MRLLLTKKGKNIQNLHVLKDGDRPVRIYSADNNWWATPEVSLPLPYQRSAKVFLNFCDKELRQCITLKIFIRSR